MERCDALHFDLKRINLLIGTVSITEVSGENKRTHIFRHLKRSKKPLGIKFTQLKVEFLILCMKRD